MPLSRVLLIKDATYPWLLLVPRRHLAVEITDLDMIEQAQLMSEIAHAGRVLKAHTGCDKINAAALGNVVSQLHVHIIARSRGDAAWPRPVWNVVPPRDYDKAALIIAREDRGAGSSIPHWWIRRPSASAFHPAR
jgi:diadenosine tetraphosphate (Ap4A) HIT family hydrolase